MVEKSFVPEPEKNKRELTPERLRFVSWLRLLSGGFQLVAAATQGGAGIASGIEGLEETLDAAALRGAAKDLEAENANQKGNAKKYRKRMQKFVGATALAAAVGTGYDVIHEGVMQDGWFGKMDAVGFNNLAAMSSITAIALGSIALITNRHEVADHLHPHTEADGTVHEKPKGIKGYLARDTLKDFVIPLFVLGGSLVKAPHLAEYALEAAGVGYGVNIYTKLRKEQ